MKAYQAMKTVNFKHTYSENLVYHLLFCSLVISLFLSSYTGNRKLRPTLVLGTLSM